MEPAANCTLLQEWQSASIISLALSVDALPRMFGLCYSVLPCTGWQACAPGRFVCAAKLAYDEAQHVAIIPSRFERQMSGSERGGRCCLLLFPGHCLSSVLGLL